MDAEMQRTIKTEAKLERTHGGLKMEKPKILIVDDDADLRLALTTRLRANHYQTVQVSDGHSAIAVAHQEQPNLIILDLGLPGVDGFGVLERLQGSDTVSNIPVIVFTVHDPHINKPKALLAGATAYLQKPADNAELLAVIRATCPVVSRGARQSSAWDELT
jgi:DNA-binding response OmpR family regulator